MLCMSKMSKMGKEHTHTFWLITSLILNGFSIRKKFWKAETESFPTIPSNLYVCMSKHVEDVEDDQIHLRAVEDGKRMLCMSKMSKMGKEHTHTFWLITSLILNGFSIQKKFWKAETESFPTIPSNLMYVEDVEDVEDRSNTPKGCNAMYVEDVEDGKRTYTHILAHNFLNT